MVTMRRFWNTPLEGVRRAHTGEEHQMHTQRIHTAPRCSHQVEHRAKAEAQRSQTQRAMMAASLIVEIARLLLEVAKTLHR